MAEPFGENRVLSKEERRDNMKKLGSVLLSVLLLLALTGCGGEMPERELPSKPGSECGEGENLEETEKAEKTISAHYS